jgi:hypothetical protein
MTARRHHSAAARTSLLTPAQALVVQTLAQQFYTVVPRDYRTYCTFTASVACAALRGLGVPADLLACQMWCVTPQDNYVVGFLDHAPIDKDRWNGHVICVAGNCFIDAAVCNFERDFQLQVPTIVHGKMFGESTTVIARVNISRAGMPTPLQLWWHHAARSVNAAVPDAPAKMVADFAARLVARVRAVQQAPYPAALALSPQAIVTRPADSVARPAALLAAADRADAISPPIRPS